MIEKKILYFISFCLTLRLAIPILLLKINKKYLKYAGMILLIPAINFIILYFTNLRKNGLFNKAWWNETRLLHGILYLTSAIYCFKNQQKYASITLFIDVTLGLLNWVNKYYIKINL